MASNFISGPLLGQTFPLSDDVRVRLRLAHFSDRPKIAALLARQPREGAPNEGLAEQLVQFDPRRRYVLCACALIDGAERLVGVGAIDLDHHEVSDPDLMVIDSEVDAVAEPLVTEALTGLLWGALVGAAQAVVRARAA